MSDTIETALVNNLPPGTYQFHRYANYATKAVLIALGPWLERHDLEMRQKFHAEAVGSADVQEAVIKNLGLFSPAQVERERALARLEGLREARKIATGWGAKGTAHTRIPELIDERIAELERAAKQGELAWCWAMKEWVPAGSFCSQCGEHLIGGNEYRDPNEQA